MFYNHLIYVFGVVFKTHKGLQYWIENLIEKEIIAPQLRMIIKAT